MGRGSEQILYGDGAFDRQPSTDPGRAELVDVTEFCGIFADGWTPGQLEEVLPALEKRLGLRFLCVWEDRDEVQGFTGSSELVVLGEDLRAYAVDALWAFLLAPRDGTRGHGENPLAAIKLRARQSQER